MNDRPGRLVFSVARRLFSYRIVFTQRPDVFVSTRVGEFSPRCKNEAERQGDDLSLTFHFSPREDVAASDSAAFHSCSDRRKDVPIEQVVIGINRSPVSRFVFFFYLRFPRAVFISVDSRVPAELSRARLLRGGYCLVSNSAGRCAAQ